MKQQLKERMKELGEAINKSLSDIRTTLGIYTQITDPEVARMVNQVTRRIPGLERLSRAQFSEMGGEDSSQPLP